MTWNWPDTEEERGISTLAERYQKIYYEERGWSWNPPDEITVDLWRTRAIALCERINRIPADSSITCETVEDIAKYAHQEAHEVQNLYYKRYPMGFWNNLTEESRIGLIQATDQIIREIRGDPLPRQDAGSHNKHPAVKARVRVTIPSLVVVNRIMSDDTEDKIRLKAKAALNKFIDEMGFVSIPHDLTLSIPK